MVYSNKLYFQASLLNFTVIVLNHILVRCEQHCEQRIWEQLFPSIVFYSFIKVGVDVKCKPASGSFRCPMVLVASENQKEEKALLEATAG